MSIGGFEFGNILLELKMSMCDFSTLVDVYYTSF